MIKHCLLVCLSLFLMTNKSFSQASWEKFGQNRVQYRTFDWSFYDSTHFRTFFYKDGKANALYALSVAEQELSNIVYLMGGHMGQKLNLIIYNSFTDYRQSNIGRKIEETNSANGGKVEMVGENIPIYYNGDHSHLRKQIRKGIATVIKENMLFGESFKEAIKNSVKMNLPAWYTNGYVNFIADDWTPEMSSIVGSQMDTTKKNQFDRLALMNPELYGYSFWNFLASQFGENYVSNLLYLTRYRMNVYHAIEVVTKMPVSKLFKQWQLFYMNENRPLIKTSNDSLNGRQLITEIKAKPNGIYTHFSLAPNGKRYSFC